MEYNTGDGNYAHQRRLAKTALTSMVKSYRTASALATWVIGMPIASDHCIAASVTSSMTYTGGGGSNTDIAHTSSSTSKLTSDNDVRLRTQKGHSGSSGHVQSRDLPLLGPCSLAACQRKSCRHHARRPGIHGVIERRQPHANDIKGVACILFAWGFRSRELHYAATVRNFTATFEHNHTHTHNHARV